MFVDGAIIDGRWNSELIRVLKEQMNGSKLRM